MKAKTNDNATVFELTAENIVYKYDSEKQVVQNDALTVSFTQEKLTGIIETLS